MNLVLEKISEGEKKEKKFVIVMVLATLVRSRSRRPVMVLPENPIFPFFPPNEC